ncbi:hypothetical protein ART_3199 [Arthrobacter sp. PAMC 25486]|uniref:hypothetical protein n=1 Tax=Arthrobacter sp. PAMC 25486 TaxID=1494608 RepID=UPI000535F586|nr:hypothetical protein [Arthrobacter sp. PAMC 25486]AIY02798.1 hypothetical protein ART_3199 [Arthrobacter sp. PAMC 25486]
MAKKPKNTKKSRFGNPAKASADAAARTAARPSADARLDRAMMALSSGFVDSLEAQGRPNKSIDISLAILDDFFDMYRILEPHTDPTALVPAAVQEVMEVTAHANPMGVLTLRSGVNDYVGYLAQSGLWTGTPADLAAVLEELRKTGMPEMNDGGDLTTGVDGVDGGDYSYLDYEEVPLEDYEFAEVYIPELSREETVETAKNSPLWLNTLALLDWIGEGRELTDHGTLLDQEGAAATLSHTGVGKLSAAANFTTPQDHDAARLALYWELLETAGLITVGDTHVRPTPHPVPLRDEGEMLATVTDLIGHFIFTVTLEGSEEGIFEDWHVEMADWLTQSASAAPPESALLIQALEEPNTVHPDLLSIAQNIAHWAEEGLVTVGEFIEVPAAWRADVFDLLKDDFPVHLGGPGATPAPK